MFPALPILAQYDISCHIRFIAGGIRAINHQVVISFGGVCRYLYLVVMDMRILLSGYIP